MPDPVTTTTTNQGNTAVSTLGCLLSYGTTSTGTLTPLYSISEFPDFGAAPEDIDTTVLYGEYMTHMPGKKDVGQLEFVGNMGKYGDPADLTETRVDEFGALLQLDETTPYFWKAEFEDGSYVSFWGYAAVRVNAAAVNDRAQYTLTITYSSDFTISAAPAG